ncbi:MAG: DUF1343 domain-containing protein [Capsulimonadales bacterium]|nr:DUF1343 domain-containing protein [Capsulimonadales bacterium]
MTRRNLLRHSLAPAALTLVPSPGEAAPSSRVRTGLEVLAEDRFRPLNGLKVGLITNPTGALPDLTSTIEALHRAPGVKLAALFGPEHGVRGDIPAGEYVPSTVDSQTGVPVWSLYGATKTPTAEMLRGLDILVFDIQDIGARSYTYVSTLGSAMEGAAKHGIPLLVLDRPNPVGLQRVEGGPTRPGFESFVSKYPLAYRHGMTLGEVARMINGQGWLGGGRTCSLTVLPCRNLTRERNTWEDFGGLPWVPTSPHIPQPTTPHFYAATGILGELPTVSIGIGYPLPFELAGAPDIGAVSLTREMERRRLPGFAFRPHYWSPYYGAFKGQRCGGVQIYLTDPDTAPLTRLNFELADAFRTLDRNRRIFPESARMFDLACGTDAVRKAFLAGADARQLWEIFEEGREKFVSDRKRYLLYS